MKRQRAFTLIELLVVIAITAVLMTLIVVPIIQSFNLTRTAQAWTDAQDKARTLTERIASEINNSVMTRDNDGANGELDVVVPAKPGSGVTVAGYDNSHEWIRVPVYHAKLDIVKPFEGDPSLFQNGAFVNPLTGLADPTLKMPRGQVNLPGSPGLTIVRYWIGLRNPLRTGQGGTYSGYVEPYTGLLEQRSGLRDNLFVLYRAEVSPMVWSRNQGKFVVNKAFFYDLGRNTNSGKTGPLMDDPTFFDPAVAYPAYNVTDPDGTPDPTKAQMVQNWLNAAVIQTEVSRFDMIQPIYDMNTRQVTYDGNAPRLMTLMQFLPTRVSSEPAEGQMAVRQGQETEGASSIAPDVFRTSHGQWASNTFIRTYANTYNQGDPNNDKYMVGATLPYPATTDPQGFFECIFDPAQGFDVSQVGQTVGATRVGYEVFDGDVYKRGLHDGYRANFSRAIQASNTRSGWLTNVNWRNLFEGYVPDFDRGRAIASFGIDEVGVVGTSYPFTPGPLTDPINNPLNLPGNATWPDNTPPLSPFNDTNLGTGFFYDAQYSTINKKFNKIWNDYPGLHGNIQRFIDIRVTPNDDGAPSPLNPDHTVGYARARIVPGSDRVTGPDQNPGPNYGNTVAYTRTTREPGPNQYRINYVDLPEPDYTLLGLTPPPPNYTPNDFTSAVFQPRYKAGYIELDSDPNVPLPNGVVRVYYRFQFTQPNDVMAVDYDSRSLMTVQLTIRDYPQSSLPNPQTVTLQATASVRNSLR